MELEDLKQAWSQYDNQLKDNLKINKAILRSMNLDKSKRKMQKTLAIEIMGIAIMILTMPFFFYFSIRHLSELKFSIPGFIAIFVGTIYIIFGMVRIYRFEKIDYYNSSIIELQNKLTELKSLILKLRKIELTFLPLLVIPLLPIAYKVVSNVDIYNNLKQFIIEVIFILVVLYSYSFWIDRKLYDSKIKDIKSFLDEIYEFEQEN